MASAMPHGMLKAAAGRVSMPPSRPRCIIIGDRCPRNRDQDCDTAQDQQVAHTASSRDSQTSAPFLFDQAPGLPCKFNLNLESECLLLPMSRGAVACCKVGLDRPLIPTAFVANLFRSARVSRPL